MVRLREIPRTGAFAWSPGAGSPLIATGNAAGAIAEDSSNSSRLELWDLDLLQRQGGVELSPVISIDTDSRFYDLAWGHATAERPRGIIAGAYDSGFLELWSADALLSNNGSASIVKSKKHGGAIKSLQFNPSHSEMLATAGGDEVYVWDLNRLDSPDMFEGGNPHRTDYQCVDWNKANMNILATAGNGVKIWDKRKKTEIMRLRGVGAGTAHAVSWHPENATKLVFSTADDNNPVVLVWDIRSREPTPERTLAGHDAAVLSLAWCKQDADLLFTSGKDSKTICWNPNNGTKLGELPTMSFQTRWNPVDPDLFATASSEGVIAVNSIQSTNSGTSGATQNAPNAVDDDSFFNQASFELLGPSFSLPQAPKWMKRPAGAAFGFGGKLVTFGLYEDQPGQAKRSKFQIRKFTSESDATAATEALETAVKQGKLAELCDTRAEEAENDEEREEWRVLKVLFEKDPKAALVNHLGFKPEDISPVASPTLNGEETLSAEDKKKNRMSTFFDDIADSSSFLSELASQPAEKNSSNNPFHIYNGQESEADKQITRAITLGHYAKAVDICLKNDRISDAFMLAISGGQDCIKKVQNAYFTKNADGPNYLRLLASVVGKNMWDIVNNADIADWKEVIATLCTYATASEFPDLCATLGDRLESLYGENRGNVDLRKGATLAYVAGTKLEKAVSVWLEDLQESEKSVSETAGFTGHVKTLQTFIEKVTVFRTATKFVDRGQPQDGKWALAALYDKYVEYADVLADSGNLQLSEKYVDLIPASYAPATAARTRVKEANKKVSSNLRTGGAARANTRSPFVQQTAQSVKPLVPPAPAAAPTSTYPPAPTNQYQQPAAKPSPYAPSGAYQPAGQQAQQFAPSQNQYAPQGGYNQGGFQQGGFQQSAPPSQFAPPPPRAAAASSIPPPSKDKNMVNWNDTPIVTGMGRRGTPKVGGGPITAPFPGAAPPISPAQPGTPFGAPPQNAAPPPPPKGAMPPQRVASPQVGAGGFASPPQAQGQFGAPPRYGSVPQAGAPFAPPPQQQFGAPPRGGTPSNAYAPPPQAGAMNSRYTPAAPPPGATPGAGRPGSVPPPQGQFVGRPAGPPTNMYQPPPSQAPPQQYGAPPPAGGQYAQPGAPSAYTPQPGQQQSRPQTQQSQEATPQQETAPPPPAKHPAGDRSHIPSRWLPIVQLLEQDMQRVKAAAPASAGRKVHDTEKRLNILFDHMNNEELVSEGTLEKLLQLAEALQARNYEAAHELHLEVYTNKLEECGQWMLGVKRLIEMSRAIN